MYLNYLVKTLLLPSALSPFSLVSVNSNTPNFLAFVVPTKFASASNLSDFITTFLTKSLALSTIAVLIASNVICLLLLVPTAVTFPTKLPLAK